MKFFVVGFAVLALAAAGALPNEYLPPLQEIAAPTAEYLPPAEAVIADEPTILADDGYRYKTVKRFRLRHRRDVNEIAKDYLPPAVEEAVEVAAPAAEVAPAPESAVLADDGYQYRTVKRYRLRRRRDVNEIVNEYLPPAVEEAVEVAAPVTEVAPAPESAVLADDGYQYRTVKRYRLRRRRDVSEIANEYLPPAVEEAVEVAAPAVEVAPAPESAVLADDGYQYRTVKRYRLRRRRDVSEIANEYLPPAIEEAVEVAAPAVEVAPAPESAVLADDGYQYRTVKRYRLRRRRDVSEIANEYLPPAVEEAVEVAAPAVEVAPAPESAVLADDGYQYRTVKRYRLRRRRDVNEIANEYLPPAVEEAVEVAAPVAEVASAPESAVLADDGYQYRTVKRYRLRRRRDVSEIANEYLPPAVEEAVEVAAPAVEVAPAPESAVLADDGYQYRTVKRYRLRRRRDVNEIANEYLPPAVEEAVEVAAPAAEVAPAPESAVLADDGYQYRTVKRYRLRRRRDVSEIANEYLPPAVEEAVEVAAPAAEVAPAPESAVLADDGYQYRTVKRYRLRRRRDVNEIANEYLPPAVEEAVEVAAPVAEVALAPESAVLSDDGYQYRTVKRYRLRRRRDVSEIVNEYLPPAVEEAVEVAAPSAEVAPAPESAVLADDGYRYKTIRKLRYRYRH